MTKQKSSAGLSIELSDNRKYYTVGSKVSGNVTLDTAQDFAIGSVSIEFFGRVKGMSGVRCRVFKSILTELASTFCPEPWTGRKSLARSSTTLLRISTSVRGLPYAQARLVQLAIYVRHTYTS